MIFRLAVYTPGLAKRTVASRQDAGPNVVTGHDEGRNLNDSGARLNRPVTGSVLGGSRNQEETNDQCISDMPTTVEDETTGPTMNCRLMFMKEVANVTTRRYWLSPID